MTRQILLAVAFAALCLPVQAADKARYYYPPITSEESFSRDLGGPPADRRVRVNFMTQITKAQLAAPENPRFVIFAKGSGAEHMILVALDDEVFKTLYRARAVLAQLTSNARGTDFFIENGIEDFATWFDLARLLGFEDLVISDGETWAHKVTFD